LVGIGCVYNPNQAMERDYSLKAAHDIAARKRRTDVCCSVTPAMASGNNILAPGLIRVNTSSEWNQHVIGLHRGVEPTHGTTEFNRAAL